MLAQVVDVDVDGARFAAEGVAPDEGEQLLAGHGDAFVLGEREEQVELFGAEVEGAVFEGGFASLTVERKGADLHFGAGALDAVGAAQDGLDAGDELFGVEGLGEVVVSAEFEAGDFDGVLFAHGQHEDGDVGAFTDAFGDFEAVELGHHEVEEDEIGLGAEGLFERLGTVAGELQSRSLPWRGRRRDEFADVGLIVCDEDAHGASLRAWASRLVDRGRTGCDTAAGCTPASAPQDFIAAAWEAV